ncbi:AlpA family transcriptional regulator [Parvularcula sp. IMCC14364]|uniref:helix-turn-helix transcriptional regulator n=1 Tax=Parvularcula sp. IMCC14364 TaxID=3067902 RepID=UPI0027413175|nr:helix-turn-helix domain-containing protein [Parvularcula sp. IMCC14364]
MDTTDDNELFVTEQAADFLGLSVSWMMKARVTGDGPPFAKLSRRVMYRKSDLIAWVSERICNSTSEYEIEALRRHAERKGPAE